MKMRIALLAASAALLAVACGGSDNSAAPSTAPVLVSGTTANGSSGTTTPDGTANAVVTGAVSGVSGTCPALTFKVGSLTVKTSSSTTFNGGKCTDIKNGMTVSAGGAVQSDGSIAATGVKVPIPAPVVASVTGAVSALAGTCPAITFKVETKSVKTDASTSFGDKKCADIQNAVKVGVSGTVQTDGSILAKQVRVIPPPPVSVTGTVSALSGACPTLKFTVSGKSVTTAAATVWTGGKCADLKVDAKVGAIGVAQADGSIAATAVTILPPPPVSLSGAISGLTGTCPAVTFKIGTKTVTTNAATVWATGKCADLKADSRVAVSGMVQADGSVLAAKIGLVVPVPVPALVGVVTAVSGTCPAVTITIGTKVAVTSAATVFDGKTCADVKVGATVGIYGSVATGATSLAATKVVIK